MSDAKTTTVDLSTYGLRATIDIPEGAFFRPTSGGVTICYGDKIIASKYEYELKIYSNFDELKDIKKTERDDERIVAKVDTDDAYFFEHVKETDWVYLYFGRSVAFGERPYIVTSRIYFPAKNTKKRSDVDTLWKAVQTLRQSNEQKKIEELRTAALKKIRDWKIFTQYVNNLKINVSFNGEDVTADKIAVLKDIPDLGLIELTDLDEANQSAALRQAVEIPTAKGLSVEGAWFTDKQIGEIAGNPYFQAIRFTKVGITDKGFETLAKNDAVKELWLKELELTDAIIPTLQSMKNLKDLVLTKSKLSEGAIEKLKAARPDLKVHGK